MINKLVVAYKNFRTEMDYRKKVRTTIKELSALSNYELNDIGISRGEIYNIAITSYNKPERLVVEDVEITVNENLRGAV
ncbi:DUF1127 domain-containing protein [bacterium]|jgi:uncharacterized protein YjiS (DUF1127 family)|nr:DUF1127 domain-containing protein [bacterium]